MLMLLDFHPAFTQMAYRIGDSITPMFPYFAVVLAYVNKYDKKAKIGTFISTLVPDSVFMGIGWITLILVWYATGLPIGADGPILLNG